jgi:hypothetical protein
MRWISFYLTNVEKLLTAGVTFGRADVLRYLLELGAN